MHSQELASPTAAMPPSMPELARIRGAERKAVAWKPIQDILKQDWTDQQKLDFLRTQKVGRYCLVPSPQLWAGLCPQSAQAPAQRAMLHLDYTASAQGLHVIEDYMRELLQTYANTHTETSTTGRLSTQRFHQAIEMIREHVHAGPDSFVVPGGYGATGAIEKIQKILGLYLSPKGQKTIKQWLGIDLKSELGKKVVVFVGPYEHHSNDVTWQDDALCTFVRVKALREGPTRTAIDLADLEAQLDRYEGYLKIGSFSAASNVTGMRCDLKELGKLLHSKQALFFVDYAASGPYADINMERDGIDALYLAVHKNLGGSNLGLLIGRQHIYDRSSNPSFGGGGTVSAVTPWEYHFHPSIEEREAAGTPAIRQMWQAALSFQIKDWLGKDLIHSREHAMSEEWLTFITQHPKLELLGNPDPSLRYPILSFLVKHGDRMLHHNLVATLLNDFFGIQARSGCACAGPFGHELLGIERELSSQYVQVILSIVNGFKPGWTRIGAHYTLSDFEVQYTLKALSAIAWFGPLFLGDYRFQPYSGDWQHIHSPALETAHIDLEAALALNQGRQLWPQLQGESELEACLSNQLEEFYALAATQAARLILDEASQRGHSSISLDALACAVYPLIKEHVEDFSQNEESFLNTLTLKLCPLLAPPGKAWQECRHDIEQLVRALLFEPQRQPQRYEDFPMIDRRLHFFYVARGTMSESIQLHEAPKSEDICTPCTYTQR